MTSTTIAPTEAPNVEGVKVGDFFSCSWGYDQTNVDFYKVVALTAKRIKVQQWKSKPADGPRSAVVPGDGPATFTDWSAVDRSADYWTQQGQKVEREVAVEVKTVKAYNFNGEERRVFTVNSYSSAYRWDGTPEYVTPHNEQR